MVHAVHSQRAGAEHARQTRAWGDTHLVRQIVAREILSSEREVVVLDRPGHLFADILKQRSAGGEVDELHATTNAENRLAFGHRPSRQRELDTVAVSVSLVAQRVLLRSIRRWIDVGA